MARILVIDDEEGIRSFLAEALELVGHTVDAVPDGDAALRALSARAYDLVLTDLSMPGASGMDVLRRVREEQPHVECIVLTARGSIASAVEAMKLGAFDYLQKPLGSPEELALVVARALERRRLVAFREAQANEEEIVLTWGAPSMQGVVRALEKVAPTTSTVLLQGESGSGKEIAARFVHAKSERRDGPFVAVNCAAFADTLLESELFGHEKGAFTGAHAQRRGRIELAEGGTLFLDEIAELKLDLQAKLLRVLQERRFERVGGSRTLDADVRFVAATHKDLKRMVSEGSFRQDLYYRLAVFGVEMVPLRSRVEDMPPLVTSLLAGIARDLGVQSLSVSEAALERIQAADWPGNVRELKNALERAAILCDRGVITPADLQVDSIVDFPSRGAQPPATQRLEEMEIAAIREALAREGGNRQNTAAALGIGLRTLYEKLKRYGIK